MQKRRSTLDAPPHMVVVGGLAGASPRKRTKEEQTGAGPPKREAVYWRGCASLPLRAPAPPARPLARAAHRVTVAAATVLLITTAGSAAPAAPQRESFADFHERSRLADHHQRALHIFAESHWVSSATPLHYFVSTLSSDTIRWCRKLLQTQKEQLDNERLGVAGGRERFDPLIGRIGRLLTDVVKEDQSLASQFKQKARWSVAPGTMPAAGAQNQHTFFSAAVAGGQHAGGDVDMRVRVELGRLQLQLRFDPRDEAKAAAAGGGGAHSPEPRPRRESASENAPSTQRKSAPLLLAVIFDHLTVTADQMADGALHCLCSLRDLAVIVAASADSCARCAPPTVVDLDEGGARAPTEAAAASHAGGEARRRRGGDALARARRQRSALEDPQERVHALTLYHSTATQAVSLSSLVETLRSVHLHETNKRVADLNEATKRHREEKVRATAVSAAWRTTTARRGRRRTASAAASRCNEGSRRRPMRRCSRTAASAPRSRRSSAPSSIGKACAIRLLVRAHTSRARPARPAAPRRRPAPRPAPGGDADTNPAARMALPRCLLQEAHSRRV